jgi:hypothetical protein
LEVAEPLSWPLGMVWPPPISKMGWPKPPPRALRVARLPLFDLGEGSAQVKNEYIKLILLKAY